jgi:3-hydroxyacyl-CoA dehydrogenase
MDLSEERSLLRPNVNSRGLTMVAASLVSAAIVEGRATMDEINEVTRLELRNDIAVLEIDAPPVNALGIAVRRGLLAGLSKALADPAVKAVIIACGGRTFFAGADIKEIGRPIELPHLFDIIDAIEAAAKPVVASIHGAALGGGFELALACHYRIAASSAKVGLPEVNLGLMPGAGGTQRVPRLMGVVAALEMMTSGKPISALLAHAKGLIDAIAKPEYLRSESVEYARRLVLEEAPLILARDRLTDIAGDRALQAISEFKEKHAGLFKGFKAPSAIVKAVEAAAISSFTTGLAREAELFQELAAGPESAAQRYLFFAERSAAKIPSLSNREKSGGLVSTAVVGAGEAGIAISSVLLSAGFSVLVVDVDEESLANAVDSVAARLRASAENGRIQRDHVESCLKRLETTNDLVAVREVDLIIEAGPEDLGLKTSIFAQLDMIAKRDAILASNTSIVDLNQLAAATSRAQSVVGLHFVFPADGTRLLEVVRGENTSDAVLATAMSLARDLYKVAVISRGGEGLIADRLMASRNDAADRVIRHGPMPWDVDQELVAFGFPVGVFSLRDMQGERRTGPSHDDGARHLLQELMREAGRGEKGNNGFYDYNDERRPQPSPVVEDIIHDVRKRNQFVQRSYSPEDIIAEVLYPVVNEGAKLIEEGIVQRSSDIDIALVSGCGWPVWTGGPMFWADTIGLRNILSNLKAQQIEGSNIVISPLLERLADGEEKISRL